MERRRELTEEEEDILRKAAVILERVRSDQVTDAPLYSRKVFQTQFAMYASRPDFTQDVYHHRGMEDNFGPSQRVEFGNWFNDNISQTAALEGHGCPRHDWQDSGFPAYEYGQPTADLAGVSHGNEECALDLSLHWSRSSGSMEELPALTSTRSLDKVVDVDTTFIPWQLFPETDAPMIQLPAFETALQSKHLAGHQPNQYAGEPTIATNYTEHFTPVEDDAMVADQQWPQTKALAQNGVNCHDFQHLTHGLRARWEDSTTIGRRFPLHDDPSLVTTAPAPLAWDPTSMSEMVFLSNPGLQYSDTPSPAHLVNVACTPLRQSQGSVAGGSFVHFSQDAGIPYQKTNAMHILQDDVDRRPHHRKTKIGPGRDRRGIAKRQPYSTERRLQTMKARNTGICIQCRHVRKPCTPNPNDPMGQCIRCQKKTFDVFRLPCLRYKIVDSILFRTTSNLPHEASFPMVGQGYGRFDVPKTWVDTETRMLCITQDRGTILWLPVRRFVPPEDNFKDDKGLGGKGRGFFAIPWAMTDAATGLKAINAFIDESAGYYVDHIIPRDDVLLRVVFEVARRFTTDGAYGSLVANALRFWTACRFIEGGWRVCGEETLDAEILGNPLRPPGWISPPPYVDYEFASTVMHKALDPLRQKVLRDLQNLVNDNKPRHWFCIFLVVFILLHNYELIMKHEVAFASRRKLSVRYVDMNLVQGVNCGAKILLAHFRLICKGYVPFQKDFDWTSKEHKNMALLKDSEMAFMASYIKKLQENWLELEPASLTDRYEDRYWFTSQLFLDEWSPRETY